jgi:filamentous hemagglutinin family protein
MNKVYRLIWNDALQRWTVASELTKARGKRASKRKVLNRTSSPFGFGSLAFLLVGGGLVQAAPPAPNQLPVGGQVVAGQVGISSSGATTTIQQASQRAAINWQSFDVGRNAQVHFDQQQGASSVTLNRVQSGNPSQIFGQITAPGQVYLVNPDGAYFAPGSKVEVGGFIATTHNITNADFMAGRNRFTRDGAQGKIVNEGEIKADLGGYIALLAPEVRNHGVIIAQRGTVALAAGEAYELHFSGNTLASVQVEPATIKALVDNRNAVEAPGGLIILSAQAANHLQGGVVKNSGTLEASGLVNNGGRIVLEGSDAVVHTGTIKADAAANSSGQGGNVSIIAKLDRTHSDTRIEGNISAKGGKQGGTGGFVETYGGRVHIGQKTRIDTHAPKGKPGTWLIDPTDFTVTSGSGTASVSSIGATTLQSNLGTGNVTIATASSGSESGDINVNAPVTWSAHTLALEAHGDIKVNAVLTANDTATLSMKAGYSTPGASGGSYDNSKAVRMGLSSDGVFSGKVNFFQANGTTRRSGMGMLNINDQDYILITTLGLEGSTTTADLQGMDGNPTGYYALNADIDASATSSWNAGAGFKPIDFTTYSNPAFHLNGLGHVITGLHINRPADASVGLFSNGVGSQLSNLGLENTSIVAGDRVGSLISSDSNGSIHDVYAKNSSIATHDNGGGLIGRARGSTISDAFVIGGSVSGAGYAFGGLAAGIDGGTSVKNSTSSAVVSGGYAVGGLFGYGFDGSVTNSNATGNVTGTDSSGKVGGLIGNGNNLQINRVFATGNVTGSGSAVGGLVGYGTNLSLDHVFATGNVTSSSARIGGLVGALSGSSSISMSYASGAVSGYQAVGGLVGNGSGTMNGVSASGNVTGAIYYAGGLVGASYGDLHIDSAVATGNVTSLMDVGGLVGIMYNSSIANSHATGAVNASTNVGGLVGFSNGSTISNNFASGAVLGNGISVGGLVGFMGNASSVVQSYATGAVTDGSYNTVGGLIGWLSQSSSVAESFASGAVTGPETVGGLIGKSTTSSVTDSYASGVSSGAQNVGGLIGILENDSHVERVYATGDVNVTGSGTAFGGLVGSFNQSTITDAFAIGTVSGTGDQGGGLLGSWDGTSHVLNSYAMGNVSISGTHVGKLLGFMTGGGGDITSSYGTGTGPTSQINSSGSSITQTGVAIPVSGVLTTGSFKQTPTFSGANTFSTPWDIIDATSVDATWFIYPKHTYPLLRTFLTSLSLVPIADVTKTYDGVPFTTSYPADNRVLGSVSGSAIGAVNAGSYVIDATSLYSTQLGYLFTGDKIGALTVTKAPLVVTANNAGKTYDGMAYTGGNGVTYSGFANAETAAVLRGVLTYGGSSQGAINAGSYAITPTGLTSGNYAISYVDGALTISGGQPPTAGFPLPPVTPENPDNVATGAPYVPPPPVVTPVALPSVGVKPDANNNGPALGGQLTNDSGFDIPGLMQTRLEIKGNDGVSVTLVQEPSARDSGVINVSVPKELAAAGNGFKFSLPAEIAQRVEGDVTSVRVTTTSDQPLPPWLRFDPRSKTFTATSVPDGALPMEVVVIIRGQRTVIVISERQASA